MYVVFQRDLSHVEYNTCVN